MDDNEWNNINRHYTLCGSRIPTGPGPNRMPYVPLNSTTGPSPSGPFLIMPGTESGSIPLSNNVSPPFPLFTDPLTALTNVSGKINHKNLNMNMDMGIRNIYQQQHLYGPPFSSHLKNPEIIAAAKSHQPAFESIESFVRLIKTVAMMVESSLHAMQMYYQAMLKVAELSSFFKPFTMKLYATIGSFKLVRWFLTKLFYLLKMVKGERGVSAEEDLWTAISSTNQITPFDRNSWPLVIYFGLISASPYFVYKLLNSATHLPTLLSTKSAKERPAPDRASGVNEYEGEKKNDGGLIGGLHDFNQHNNYYQHICTCGKCITEKTA